MNTSFIGWAFVIDTNEYSGNFERELCAYVTGEYGECEVGKGIAERALSELPAWWKKNNPIMSHADDHGCSRPASIYPSPKRKGVKHAPLNSVAIMLHRRPSARELALMVKRAKAGIEQRKVIDIMHDHDESNAKPWKAPKILGFRLIEQSLSVTEYATIAGE